MSNIIIVVVIAGYIVMTVKTFKLAFKRSVRHFMRRWYPLDPSDHITDFVITAILMAPLWPITYWFVTTERWGFLFKSWVDEVVHPEVVKNLNKEKQLWKS